MTNQILAPTRGQLEQRRIGVTTRILFLYRCLGLVQREAEGCPDPAQYTAMENALWEKVADARAGLSSLDKEIGTLT